GDEDQRRREGQAAQQAAAAVAHALSIEIRRSPTSGWGARHVEVPPQIKIGLVVRSPRPRFVDTGNPALAVECPNCCLLAPRFLPYCKNCSFSLWPDRLVAGAAFEAWQHADPARANARPYDLEMPTPPPTDIVDYEERAHRLGIHLFPSSSY